MRAEVVKLRRRAPGVWLGMALLSAAVLPLVSFLALRTAFSAQTEQSDVQESAVDDARRVSTAVDARLERTRGAAAALVTTRAVQQANWYAAYQRATEIVEQNPDWKQAIVWDRRTGRVLVDTARPFGSTEASHAIALDESRLRGPSDLAVGGIELVGEGCPCLSVHTAAGPALPYVLTVDLNPAPFQAIVEQEGKGTLVTTLLDSAGRVLARSLNPDRFIGRQAAGLPTPGDRPSGVYRGITPEGERHFSAYWVSPLSGWSSHVAFRPEELEGSRVRSITAAIVAAVASLVVAVVLAALALSTFIVQRRFYEQETTALRKEADAQLAVARDLHDGALQFLTGLNLRLYGLRQALASGKSTPKSTQGALESLEDEVRREQRDLRRFIESLSPRSSSMVVFPDLAATAAMLTQRWGAKVVLHPDNANDLIPADLGRDVQFIVREAVSNAVRHGRARRVDVRVDRQGEDLVIVIEDDGAGFPSFTQSAPGSVDPTETPASIRDRVAQHGGSLSVEQGAVGARLRIRMPVY